MIVEQLLNLRLVLLEVDHFLIAQPYRPSELAELLPIPFESFDLAVVEYVEQLV
jgi:hypothetical protein